MQPPRGGGHPFFNIGDPFPGFGSLGSPSLGPSPSLLSNIFWGRDPFDDPFFTSPMGSMLESSQFGPSRFSFLDNVQPSGFLEYQIPEPRKSRGPIIEELNSDDEKEDAKDKKENPRKHGRSTNSEPDVDADDGVKEKKSKLLHYKNDEFNRFNQIESHPQAHSFCFQSSTVTYGGMNGTYHTSSRTRRIGSDEVTFEESKEADSSTGQATHRVSRALHNKGHSLSRKLHSDGIVDTMQTLHNLNEDELDGFEEAWKGNAQKYLPGWTGSVGEEVRTVLGGSSSGQAERGRQGRLALPSTHGIGTIAEVRDNVECLSSSSSWCPQERARTNAINGIEHSPRMRMRMRRVRN